MCKAPTHMPRGLARTFKCGESKTAGKVPHKERNTGMSELKLYTSGRTVHYIGTRKDGSLYNIVSTKAVLIDSEGRREYHDVILEAMVWDAIASVASIFDEVTLSGDLVVPGEGEPGAYKATRKDGSTYMVGRLFRPTPTGLKKSSFPAGHLPLADELPLVDKREESRCLLD